MTALWQIALITFKEGIRMRVLYALSFFVILLFGANVLITGMIPMDAGKVAVDMVLSSTSFVGLLFVLFIGMNLMAKDLDKRTIYMVLARPITRPQYIFGKFFGMALLVFSAVFILSIFSIFSITMIKILYPGSFLRFSWSTLVLAFFFITLLLLLLSALNFLFGSITSSSFTAFSLTVISYIIGQSLSDVKAIVETPQSLGISSVTVKAVQAAYYIFPNLSLFDIKTQAAHGLSVSFAYVFWVATYGLVYTCLAVVLASLFFRKKEFP